MRSRLTAGAFRACIVLALALFPLLLHLARNAPQGRLTPEGYDRLQAGRYLARERRLGTLVVRPLEVRLLPVRPDGSLPDLRHPPLFSAVTAVALRSPGGRSSAANDRAALWLGIALAAVGALATAGLSARLFAGRGALRAALFFTLASGALTVCLTPNPALLAAPLFAALLATLAGVEPGRPRVALAAGALWGALFLSLYSSLVFLPLLAIYVGRVGGRAAVVRFLLVALVVASPRPFLAWRASGNPLFHADLPLLMAYTDSYPGDGLYHLSGLPKSILSFLADGGVKEVLRKVGRHLTGLVSELVSGYGPVTSLLFVGAGLIRFVDPLAQRLRGLVFALLGAHAVGLTLFFPAPRCAELLLVHLPAVAVFGAASLETLVRSRRPPRALGQRVLWGWSALAVLPGVALLWGGPTRPPAASAALARLEEPGGFVERWQAAPDRGLLASDRPAEMAYRLGIPVLGLPPDQVEALAVSERLGRLIDGVILTATARDDRGLSPAWRDTSERVSAFWMLLSALPPRDRAGFAQRYQMDYPMELQEVLIGSRPEVVAEPDGGHSIILGQARIMAGR